MRNQRERRAVRMTVIAFAVTAVVAVAALAAAGAVTHDDDSGSPQHTVRDFLVSAVVDQEGLAACPYLTDYALQSVRAFEPRGMSCVTAMASAGLTLGGERVDAESEVKALSYRTERRGKGVRVTVSTGGAAQTFVLLPATRTELGEFDPPPTQWRIDSGIDALLPR
jgi:hypothetical protein